MISIPIVLCEGRPVRQGFEYREVAEECQKLHLLGKYTTIQCVDNFYYICWMSPFSKIIYKDEVL